MTKNLNVKIEIEILEQFDKKIKELNKDPFGKKTTKTSFVREAIINFLKKK